MAFTESIDPFLMQLFIVPLIVIGLGLLAAIFTKKVWVAPLITLLLNLIYETWYSKYYYPESELILTSWNIIFPAMSLFIAWGLVYTLKLNQHTKDSSDY
ncbi:hypothetical protein HMI01_12230 [Halolactibacillus miurensis]|uniref:Uncharacterized protein n=1 Tax=Halolactibacillus miurensis TaxID=306541 RepID=A0A1I6T081_9BACI|nr:MULTISPECIES: hypothetical protein [Halolactibacillus]GEM04235.1 hypothetical protein HMI01_12230 [Halolactibacillus miurensis]SFS82576.1 hypothetical protein SAMN05421668_11191 [Halolactibacillus miurensis]